MFLYIVSLVIGLFGTAALSYAFCRSLDRNYGRRNKRPISYLAPVFLSLLLIYFSVDYTMPRLFDLIPLIAKDYEVLEVTADEEEIRWTALLIDGKPYYYNRFQYKPVAATPYRLTALPNSRHVIALDKVTIETIPGGNHAP